MAKDMTKDQLSYAAGLKDEGLTWDQVFDQTQAHFKLADRPTYSQCWLAWKGTKLAKAEFITADGPSVAEARSAGFSWGEIAVKAQIPESRVRKLFSAHTNVRSEGLRKGAGGRFLRDEEAYYMGDARVTGTVFEADKAIPSPEQVNGVEALVATRSLAELRALAKSMGLPAAGSKVALAEAIATAPAVNEG